MFRMTEVQEPSVTFLRWRLVDGAKNCILLGQTGERIQGIQAFQTELNFVQVFEFVCPAGMKENYDVIRISLGSSR